MSTLVEIEKAAAALSPEQKRELMHFLGVRLQAETNGHNIKTCPPTERAADLKRWAASHEGGPGLSSSATGRDAIYD